MKLVDLTWTPYRIPFRAAFRTAHGLLAHRTGAIVTAITDEGITGRGEFAPLPEHSGPGLDIVLGTLALLACDLRGRELAELLMFLKVQSEEDRLPSSLVCGLETALFDALAQAGGQSMAALLASGYPGETRCEPVPPRARVPVNAVIGGTTVEQAARQAKAALSAGFSCLKLKLTGAVQEMLERVKILRAVCGPGVSLRLDANEGWSFEQAGEFLAQCAVYDIQYIEQPLPACDLNTLARLREGSGIPIAADEALTGRESVRRVLETRAADVLILKPQRVGGLQICRQIVQEASRRNIACVLTSSLEAGIGVAATLHLAAALPQVTLPCGLATLALLEHSLLLKDLAIEQGHMAVPDGPGLGVELNRDALRGYVC